MAEEKRREKPAKAKKAGQAEANKAERTAKAKKAKQASAKAGRANDTAASRGKTGIEKPSAEKPGKKQKLAKKPGVRFFEKHLVLVTAVACIAIIAVAAAIVLAPRQMSVEGFWAGMPATSPPEKGTVKMIIITTKRCPACEDGSSLSYLFAANNIDYGVNRFEESSEDGMGLIQATGVKKLPAFLIEEESITDSMLVKTKSGIAPLKDVLHFYVKQGKGTYVGGIFAFPEMDLDGNIRPKILLNEQCGDEQNFSIELFADPYDPNTIATSKDFENLRNLFEPERDVNFSFEYNYLPTYSLILQDRYLRAFGGKPDVVRKNLEEPAKHLICANDEFGTEGFNLLQQAIYSTYCEIDANTIATANPKPLGECSDSNRFDIFLTADEMVEAAKKAGIYGKPAFNECLYDVDDKIEVMGWKADVFGIERTPTVLVNCMYEVPVGKVVAAVCKINESLGFCMK